MKHRFLYLTLLATIAYTGAANAQDECSDTFWGSSTRYANPQGIKTATPADYKPSFVNFVGRNGSSFMQTDAAIQSVFKLMHKADSAKAVTEEGKKLSDMISLIEKIEKPHLGNLTQSGVNELKDIGARLYINYQPAFTPGACIKVSSVNDLRMLQSAKAMFDGMGRNMDAPGCEKINLKDEDNLQPFEVSPALKTFAEKGDWKEYAEDYVESKKGKNFDAKFLERFFQKAFLEDVDDDVKSKFIANLYNIALATRALDNDLTPNGITYADINVRSYFTCSDFELYYHGSSTGDFYKSAAGNDKLGIQVTSAVPLFINLLTSTDAYSMGGTVAADLRFTSSESIAALATMLEFKGYNKVSKDAYKVDAVWKSEEVIPMAANIQMVFYKGTSADTRSYFLVKFLLNENEMLIDGLKPKTDDVYYLWDDVKTFYYKKLNEQLEIEKINDNMHNYLMNLKN